MAGPKHTWVHWAKIRFSGFDVHELKEPEKVTMKKHAIRLYYSVIN